MGLFREVLVIPVATDSSPAIAFGPVLPGWGSWHWAGEDIREDLAKYFRTVTFSDDQIPDCDVLFFIKHSPTLELVERAARRASVIYCPIDFYSSLAHIDSDGPMLRRCSRILVHCERLRKYFEPYATVEYIDHHVKFAGIRSQGSGFRGQGSELRAQRSEIRSQRSEITFCGSECARICRRWSSRLSAG